MCFASDVENDRLKSLVQGAVGEASVDLECLKQGFLVFASKQDGCPIDRVLMSRNGILKTCEVKSCSRLNGPSFTVELRTSDRSSGRKKFSTNKNIDILAVYLEPESRVLFFDAKSLKGRTSLKINRNNLDAYGQSLKSLFGLV